MTCLASSGSALAGSADVPPEHQTGSVGEYAFMDGPTDTAVTCRYGSQLPPKLKRFVVEPPELFWPDTSSDNDHQHGLVGWRVILKRSTDGASWSTFLRSDIQTAVAYEDEAAPLTKRWLTVAVSGNPLFRIVAKAIWFRKSGAVKGTLTHWFQYEKHASDAFPAYITEFPCPNKMLN